MQVHQLASVAGEEALAERAVIADAELKEDLLPASNRIVEDAAFPAGEYVSDRPHHQEACYGEEMVRLRENASNRPACQASHDQVEVQVVHGCSLPATSAANLTAWKLEGDWLMEAP